MKYLAILSIVLLVGCDDPKGPRLSTMNPDGRTSEMQFIAKLPNKCDLYRYAVSYAGTTTTNFSGTFIECEHGETLTEQHQSGRTTVNQTTLVTSETLQDQINKAKEDALSKLTDVERALLGL